jgi:hypothetical protein
LLADNDWLLQINPVAQLSPVLLRSAEISGNVTEDPADLSTEECQGCDRYDSHKSYNQSVLGQALSFLIFPEVHKSTSFYSKFFDFAREGPSLRQAPLSELGQPSILAKGLLADNDWLLQINLVAQQSSELLRSAEIRGDVTKDSADLATEKRQCGNRDDSYKSYNQSVLGQALSFFIFPEVHKSTSVISISLIYSLPPDPKPF